MGGKVERNCVGSARGAEVSWERAVGAAGWMDDTHLDLVLDPVLLVGEPAEREWPQSASANSSCGRTTTLGGGRGAHKVSSRTSARASSSEVDPSEALARRAGAGRGVEGARTGAASDAAAREEDDEGEWGDMARIAGFTLSQTSLQSSAAVLCESVS